MMSIPRSSTGIDTLDSALEGGYPKGGVISLYGTSSPQRRKIALSFLSHGIDEGEQCLYITTRDSITTIRAHLDKLEFDLDPVVYLDAVHWRVKRVNPELNTSAQYEVNNLTDLNALLAKIMEACKNRTIDRIYFDSLSSILLYSTPGKEQVYKFFELLTAFTRSHQITLCYTIEQDVHSSDIVSTLHFLSDGVINCGNSKSNEQRATIEISQMILTDFTKGPLQIT